MNGKPVFGFVGRAGAGKDSVASHLERKYRVLPYGFAVPLKEMCCRVFGWDQQRLMGPGSQEYKEAPSCHDTWDLNVVAWALAREGGIQESTDFVLEALREADVSPRSTRRHIMQVVGTEVFRSLHPHYWVDRALSRVDEIRATTDWRGVALTDVRFPNEAQAIRETYGDCGIRQELADPGSAVIVKVVRLGQQVEVSNAGHSSEQLVDQIEEDFTLSAEFGHLNYLYELMDAACKVIGFEPCP